MSEKKETIQGLASVVICAWNNWPELEMTIESALHQSCRPLEVIVVDNSSTDATPEEVPKRFGQGVRYIHQSNKDTAGAYNAGFEVARGEFIQFLDGDDVLAPNKLEKQIAMFRANPELDIVYGDLGVFQTGAGAANWTIPPTRVQGDMLEVVLSSQVGVCTDLGMLFHRRALEKVGPWDESLYVEDLDYLLRAAWAGCRFAYCPAGPMGFARVHPGAKTRNAIAMDLGNEAVWYKALGYITQEPYRSLVAAKLAHLRFHMAVSSEQVTCQTALEKLALARATSPETITSMKYLAAWLTIVIPEGRHLARSRPLRPMRRILGRLLQRGLPSGSSDRSDSKWTEAKQTAQ